MMVFSRLTEEMIRHFPGDPPQNNQPPLLLHPTSFFDDRWTYSRHHVCKSTAEPFPAYDYYVQSKDHFHGLPLQVRYLPHLDGQLTFQERDLYNTSDNLANLS